VVEERLREEQPGRVDQQGGVGVLGQGLDGVVDLPASWPMMTALPPTMASRPGTVRESVACRLGG
jgi:hypothetical protein